MALESAHRALSAYQVDDVARHRAWLAAVIAAARRLDAHGSKTSVPVHASYAAWFFPVHTVAPDGSQHRIPTLADARLVAGPAPELPLAGAGGRVLVSVDGGGAFVRYSSRRTDGEITRDPRRIAHLLGASGGYLDWILPVVAAPTPPAAAGRGPATQTLVEAFLFWALRGAMGPINAARRILAWEAELEAPWLYLRPAQAAAGELARRRLSGDRLAADEAMRLRRAERAIVTAARRARPALGRFDPT